MIFPEQIANIPLLLVQQGWRLRASRETDKAWRAISLAHRWNYRLIQQTDGNYLELAQPVIEVAEGVRVCAHQGWGDGLAPTPEMVKVWSFWWYRAASECQPHVVEVFHDEVLKLVSDRMHERPIARARGEWLGPVLPPVTP